MPIDYSTSPLPANGQARSAAALSSTFQNIQTTYNAFETSTNNILTARTASSNPNTLIQRDANAAFQAGSVVFGGATTISNGVATISANVTPGQTVDVINLKQSDGTNAFRVDQYGNAIFAAAAAANRSLTIYGTTTTTDHFVGPLTGNVTGTATSFATPQPITSTLSDYRVTPGGAGTVSVAAGQGYIDSLGNYISAGSATTVTLPAQPTGTNLQYCWITKSTGTGTPHSSTNGVVGPFAGTAVPAYPIGEKPIALVTWNGVTNRPSGVVTQADILDVRLGDNSGSAGTGGGTGTYTPASPLVAVGASGSTLDLNNLLSGGQLTNATAFNGVVLSGIRTSPRIVGDGATHATLDDYLNVAVSGDILGALAPSGATLTLRVPNGKPPIFARIGGKAQSFVAGTTYASNTVTTAGAYILAADLNSTGPGGALQLVSTLGTLQVGLLSVWWDGSAFYTTAPHGYVELTKPIINGLNFQPLKLSTGYISTSTLPVVGSATILPTAPTLTFNLGVGGMEARLKWNGNLRVPSASVGEVRLYALYSSGAGIAPNNATTGYAQWLYTPVSSIIPGGHQATIPNLGPGPVNFTLGYYATAVNHDMLNAFLEVEMMR